MHSIKLRPAWPALIALALALTVPAQAQEAKKNQGEARNKIEQETAVPCDKIPETLAQVPPGMRPTVARSALRQPCLPMPAGIRTALRYGKWDDGAPLERADRLNLLAIAVSSRYGNAESLAVHVLEEGTWPDSSRLRLEEGAAVIRSLKPVLDTYRVNLLLDIYEQQQADVVRQAILETLRGAPQDQALLPAVHAYYETVGEVQQAGLANLKEQPEKNAPEVLARLIRKLPDGPLQAWAVRLADRHPSDEVKAAMKEKGLDKAAKD